MLNQQQEQQKQHQQQHNGWIALPLLLPLPRPALFTSPHLGLTAVQEAVRMDHLEVVKLMEQSGGKVWEDGHVSQGNQLGAAEPSTQSWVGDCGDGVIPMSACWLAIHRACV